MARGTAGRRKISGLKRDRCFSPTDSYGLAAGSLTIIYSERIIREYSTQHSV